MVEIILDPLDYFKNMFDKVIEEDSKNEELFEYMIKKNGTQTVFALTKLLKYKNCKQIYEKAFRVYIVTLFNQKDTNLSTEIVFGCRNPKSKGYWDGVHIVLKNKNENFKAYSFINHNATYKESYNLNDSIKLYNKYIKQKWIPMTIHDIIKTLNVNINININTILTPPKNLYNNKKKYIPLYIFAVGILTLLIKQKH